MLAAASSRNVLVAIPLALVGSLLAVPAFLRLVPHGTLRLAGPLPAAVGTRGVLTFAFFGVDADAPQSPTVLGYATAGQEGPAAASLQLCDTLGVALGGGPLWSSSIRVTSA